MKKLLLKILLLVSSAFLIMSLGLPFLKYPDDDSYEAACFDKHKLLKTVESPRIIFVGGSNLAFNLDSKLVEEAMGMHVINMGMHAGLGLRYMVLEVKPYIRRGDIVVIIPEYDHFFGTVFDGSNVTVTHFFSFPEDQKSIKSPKLYLSILRNYPSALRNQFLLFLTKGVIPAKRKDFNEYGDFVGHLKEAEQNFGRIECSEVKGEVNKDVVPELNNFKLYSEKTGAKVFFIYPSFLDARYKINKEKINLLCNTLGKELKIPILSAPLNYVFPEAYFYGSSYHLGGEGRNMCTKKIIADLKKGINIF